MVRFVGKAEYYVSETCRKVREEQYLIVGQIMGGDRARAARGKRECAKVREGARGLCARYDIGRPVFEIRGIAVCVGHVIASRGEDKRGIAG